MDAEDDLGIQIVLQQGIDARKLCLGHGAEGIHDGKPIGAKAVDLFKKAEERIIRIPHDVDGIHEERIALVHHPPAEL